MNNYLHLNLSSLPTIINSIQFMTLNKKILHSRHDMTNIHHKYYLYAIYLPQK